MKKRRKSPEYDLQKAVCAYLTLAGVKGIIWFAIPNGLVSDPISVSRMKAIGLRPGVADLCIIAPGGKAHFLELKAGNGDLSAAQVAFMFDCAHSDTPHAVARSIDVAVATLRNWGLLNIAELPSNFKAIPPKAPRLLKRAA